MKNNKPIQKIIRMFKEYNLYSNLLHELMINPAQFNNITNHKWLIIFTHFLNDNNIAEDFLRNLNNANHFYLIAKNIQPFLFLTAAFIWENTPQGRNFWQHIDDKWITEVKKRIFK